ncbi:hypothetical protein MUY35_04020 [Aliiroseovarius sp. S1339]|uniref:hypothetical protein n=1 Tax=Aliiroseovarius sp. S1339 TaxID=2936990 RepID=UPI0020BEFBB6|nr:hypothetical protein [Aliiroseovarius sp. S1339]MCK8463013.1 hypothetical protein [Aliiroseovarius sp. S1339]
MGKEHVIPPIAYPQCSVLDVPTDAPTLSRAPWYKESSHDSFDFVVPGIDFDDAVTLLKKNGDVLNVTSDVVKSSGKAGALYEDLIKVSVKRFERTVREVADEAKAAQKYTPEMGRKIIAARRTMISELKGVSPVGTYFKFEPNYPELKSAIKTERIAKRLQTLSERGVVSSPSVRSLVKKGRRNLPVSEKYVQTSRRYAKSLKRLGGFVEAVQIAPEIATVLTTDDQEEFKRSLASLAGAGTGLLVSRAAPFLCLGFGLATGGFGLIACGVAINVAGGTILADIVELQTKQILDAHTL